jgi:hypothetical protein
VGGGIQTIADRALADCRLPRSHAVTSRLVSSSSGSGFVLVYRDGGSLFQVCAEVPVRPPRLGFRPQPLRRPPSDLSCAGSLGHDNGLSLRVPNLEQLRYRLVTVLLENLADPADEDPVLLAEAFFGPSPTDEQNQLVSQALQAPLEGRNQIETAGACPIRVVCSGRRSKHSATSRTPSRYDRLS